MIRRRKRPRPLRKGRAAEARRECDKLWTQLILARAGGRCARCGKGTYVQAHHIRSCRHWNTRFDLENGLALCRGCHFWAHNHLDADDQVEFYGGFGRDYKALKARSLMSGKGTDYALLSLVLKRGLEGCAGKDDHGLSEDDHQTAV